MWLVHAQRVSGTDEIKWVNLPPTSQALRCDYCEHVHRDDDALMIYRVALIVLHSKLDTVVCAPNIYIAPLFVLLSQHWSSAKAVSNAFDWNKSAFAIFIHSQLIQNRACSYHGVLLLVGIFSLISKSASFKLNTSKLTITSTASAAWPLLYGKIFHWGYINFITLSYEQ